MENGKKKRDEYFIRLPQWVIPFLILDSLALGIFIGVIICFMAP